MLHAWAKRPWQAGPYLGTLRPWAQEIFAPPHLFVFSYVHLSFQVQLISSTTPAIPLGTNIVFSIDLP